MSYFEYKRRNFAITGQNEKDLNNGLMVYSLSEICAYFEILTLVLIPDTSNDALLRLDGCWNVESNLNNRKKANSSLTKAYLNSPHYLIEIKSDRFQSEAIKILINMYASDFSENDDFMSFLITPVKF